MRLFLFVSQKDGELKKILESKSLAYCYMSWGGNSCAIDIRKNSIYILSDYVHNGFRDGYSSYKQYKNIGGHFVLIGEEQVISGPCDNEPCHTRKEISINYLNKKSIIRYDKMYDENHDKDKVFPEKIIPISIGHLRTLEEDYGSEVNYKQ